MDSTQINGIQQALTENGIDKNVMSGGMAFLHESIHTEIGSNWWKKPTSEKEKVLGRFKDDGFQLLNTDKKVNFFRSEKGMPTRYAYNTTPGTLQILINGKIKNINFTNKQVNEKTNNKAKEQLGSFNTGN